MARERDYHAEYQARKERAIEQGYSGYYALRKELHAIKENLEQQAKEAVNEAIPGDFEVFETEAGAYPKDLFISDVENNDERMAAVEKAAASEGMSVDDYLDQMYELYVDDYYEDYSWWEVFREAYKKGSR